MEKSFSSFCVGRCLGLWETASNFTGNLCSIYHNIFGFSRVYAYTVNGKFGTCSIKVFICNICFIATIYCICIISFEIVQIETVCTNTNFFIRSKTYPNISMWYVIIFDFFYGSYNFGNTDEYIR